MGDIMRSRWFKKKKIFISWSGEMSKKVAEALRDWIPTVIQHLEPFMSSIDIEKGGNWFERVNEELNCSSMGIICLTSGNGGSPWINFEAGEIFREARQYSNGSSTPKDKLYTLLFNVSPSKLAGPLKHFQYTEYEKNDILKLLITINKDTETHLSEQILKEVFESRWESLRRELQRIKNGVWLGPPKQEYLPFKFVRANNSISAFPCNGVKSISEKMDLQKWKNKVDEMIRFMNGEVDEIIDVGLAIGVQNFIYLTGDNQLLAGLRTKAVSLNVSTGAVLANGAFNTGYAIIRGLSKNNIDPWKSLANLQDLFNTKNIDEKNFITRDSDIYSALSSKSSKNICDIKFIESEQKTALMFVNASRFFPRFEVGIIKYMNLPELIEDNYIDGFGKDSFEDENYWIWIADGKIIMRSYSSGRYIPDIGVDSPLYDKQWLLIKNEYLKQEFGLTEQYLPLASDEELNLDVTLNRPLSSPARSIAEIF